MGFRMAAWESGSATVPAEGRPVMWGADTMMGWGGGWGWFGLVHMLLWWLLIIIGIAVLVKWFVGAGGGAGTRSSPTDDRALAILRERYARGEIDKAEFEARKRDLGG
jgi:putative membrane protein